MLWSLKSASLRRRDVAFGLVVFFAAGVMTGCAGLGSGPGPDQTFALAELRAQRALAPDEPYWPFQMARQRYAAGESAPARAHLDTALSLDANYAPAVSLLAKIHYDAGEFTTAATLLQEYLQRNAEAPDALRVALALNLQALAEPEQTAHILAACQDQSGPVQTARTFARLQGEDYQTSLETARTALEDNPHSAANLNNLGVSLLYAGQPTAAREAFAKALAIAPDLPGAMYNLAIVEHFYFYDTDAGREYFRRYQLASGVRPAADPDDLAAVLGGPDVVAGGDASLVEQGADYER